MNKLDVFLKGKQAWEVFCRNHPQFPSFLEDANAKGIAEGTDIAITVTYPDGESKKAGLRIKPSDLELLALLRQLH